MISIDTQTRSKQRIDVLRCALTGAAVLGSLFFLCWVGAIIFPTFVSHMFVALFTQAVFTTIAALVQGLCSAVVFGALAGTFVAIFYNIFVGFSPDK